MADIKDRAREYLAKHSEYSEVFGQTFIAVDTFTAMVEFAEQETKELEVTNKKISDECHKLVDTLEKKQKENELLETQNIKLQAEVSRLTIKNADLIGKIAFTENALNNTKAQIEKMKCCSNCKNEGDYKEPYRYGTGWCNICTRHKVAKGNFDKWEIKEK